MGGFTMKVDKDMTIGEVIRENPKAIRVLMSFGLGCVGCPASQMETLEEASMVHGFDVNELIAALEQVS